MSYPTPAVCERCVKNNHGCRGSMCVIRLDLYFATAGLLRKIAQRQRGNGWTGRKVEKPLGRPEGRDQRIATIHIGFLPYVCIPHLIRSLSSNSEYQVTSLGLNVHNRHTVCIIVVEGVGKREIQLGHNRLSRDGSDLTRSLYNAGVS